MPAGKTREVVILLDTITVGDSVTVDKVVATVKEVIYERKFFGLMKKRKGVKLEFVRK